MVRRRHVALLPNLLSGISSSELPSVSACVATFPRLPQCLCLGASCWWRRGLYLAAAIHSHCGSFQLVMDEWRIFIPQLFSHFQSFLSPFPPSFQQTLSLLCAAFLLSLTRVAVVRQPSDKRTEGNTSAFPPPPPAFCGPLTLCLHYDNFNCVILKAVS